jgi:uncharacterized protein
VAFPSFNPAPWWRNAHVQTAWPALFRRVPVAPPQRERIITPDDDFLDLDWYRGGHPRLLIISHGLEGSSRRPYVLGLAREALASGWDVLAWNFRSCSGELNRQPRFYHSGETKDLALVVRHGLLQGYERIALSGFSIGGNMTLVYLGKPDQEVPPMVSGALVFSVPCDLAGSADRLARPANRVYMHWFVRLLSAKMRRKHEQFPGEIHLDGLRALRTFHQFDDRYTAPLHGFSGARDYWDRCSSAQYIPGIRVPVLIVNALDDPFLSPECFPHAHIARNPGVILETPRHGGHVGFMERPGGDVYWSEKRALAFLNEGQV